MSLEDLFTRHLCVDMSDHPVELVAEHAARIRLTSWREIELVHPDLWHDGRWIEP